MRRIRQRLADQAVGRRGRAPPRAHAVDRRASGIEGAGEGAPTAPDTNVGLSDTPGPLGGLEMTAQPLLQLGTGVLDPAPDGRVVRFQTALAEPLVAIAERERVPQGPAHSAQNQLGLGLSPREDRRSNGLLHHLFRLPAAAGRSCHTTDHRLMQRLSGTARDFFVVAAISTINVEVVLGEFVRCFHRPPGNSSPTRRSTVGGGGTRKPARDPIGYGREAMRWRMWSNWRQVSARSGGQSLKKYNRFDITDHHRSDMGPSKPRVGRFESCRARHFPREFADCAAATPHQSQDLAGYPDETVLLPLPVLALMIGVHVRTLHAAARSGRLGVAYDTRTTFRRLRPRATLKHALDFRRHYYGTQRRPPATPVPLTWASVPEDYDVSTQSVAQTSRHQSVWIRAPGRRRR